MNEKSGGIGVIGVLTIVFIVLKLCNVISWSWLWVLSPIWISTAFVLAVCVIIAIIMIVQKWYLKRISKK